MHAIIRRYRTSSVEEVVRRIQKEFLSVITTAPGFVAYYVIDEGRNTQSSISIFETQQHAEYSNRLAEYWVKEHAEFLLNSPEITTGEVLLCDMGAVRSESAPDGVAASDAIT